MKKKCSLCGEYKTVEDFYYKDKEHTKKDCYCKGCSNWLSKLKMRILRERNKRRV